MFSPAFEIQYADHPFTGLIETPELILIIFKNLKT